MLFEDHCSSDFQFNSKDLKVTKKFTKIDQELEESTSFCC
jgi:hypothetical protein